MPNRPKPTALKLLQGNPGHRPINANEPQIVADLGDVPDWLTAEQALHWHNAVEACPPGMLKATERAALANYCVHYQTVIDASVAMQSQLMVVQCKGMLRKNPLLTIIHEASAAMMRCCIELGFTPAARSKVTVHRGADRVNEFDEFHKKPARKAS